MAIRPRGSQWQADVAFRRRRIRRDFPTREAAEQWHLDSLQKIRRGEPPDEPAGKPSTGGPTLQDAVTSTINGKWKGTRGADTAETNANDCMDRLGKLTPISEITTEKIDAMIQHFASAGMKNGTINRKLAALSTILRFAHRRGWIDRLPHIERKKETEHRIRYLSLNEERTLLDVLKDCATHEHRRQSQFVEFRDAVMVLIDTGMRLGEILRLDWSDCVDDAVRIWGDASKSGRSRSVPMTDRVRVVLNKRREADPRGEKVFPNLSEGSCEYAWQQARTAMGMENDAHFVIHALRHTFCSRLVQRGVPIPVVQKLAGHSAITTTMRYVHLGDADLTAAVGKLNLAEAVRVSA